MPDLFAPVLSALISSSVFAFLLSVVFLRRSKQIEAEIKLRMDRLAATATSQRQWKERAIADLLGPVYMQLDRTRRAFDRWTTQNLFLEAKVIREGNLAIRDLLLQKGHLIPPELLEDAGKLVEHYDRWLEEYEKQRLAERPDLDAPFTFVGPQGFPFPQEADRRFRAAFKSLWVELYGVAA